MSGDSYYDIPLYLFSGVDGKVMKEKAATSQDDLNALWLMRKVASTDGLPGFLW